MRILPLVLGVAVVLGGFAAPLLRAADEFPGVNDKWHCYESPHCELFSRAGERDSRELLHRLELLQGALVETMGLRERRAIPVTIFYFGTTKEFLHYVPDALRSEERTAAYHVSYPDRAIIMLSPAWDDDDARRMIFHEYVHHIMSLTDQKPALWFSEGMAELYSTIQETKGGLTWGLGIPEHGQALQHEPLIPLDALFAADHSTATYNEAERAGMFYAESWALLHYWYCGDLRLTPEQKKRRSLFFEHAAVEGESGDPEVRRQLFERATGLTYRAMEEELRRYVRDPRFRNYKLLLPQIAPASSYTARAVPRAEIRLRLAEMDLRINRSATAKLALLDAIGRDPREFRAREVLGTDAWFDNDETEAHDRWQDALTAGSTNPAVYYQLADLEYRRWFSRFDYTFRLPVGKATELRDLLHASIAAAPKQAHAYEVLAWVEATAEKPSPKDINLVQDHLRDVQERGHTLLALAMVRTRLGDFASARMILQVLSQSSEAVKYAADAQVLLDYMEQHEAAGTPAA